MKLGIGVRRALGAFLLVAAGEFGAAAVHAQEVKVGGIFDLTGITSDVGKIFAQANRDAVEWANGNGGINGKKIKLAEVDYGYKVPEAVAAYKRLVNDERVVMISGWGTGDTEALKEFVNRDKIPYFSGSFSAALTDASKTPYNFFVAPSYSDQLRAWLSWVKEDWKDRSRNPKVAFIYGDNAYGRSPMEAGRQFAKEIGIDLVEEAIVPGSFQDATSQLLNIQKKGADYAFINVTTTGVAIILKDASRLGLKTKFGSNCWGFHESLARVARGSAEGVTGAMPHVPYGANVPGMKRLIDFNKNKKTSVPLDATYVRGWSSALVWIEALRRADKAGKLSGEGIKEALQGMSNYDLGGLTANVSYSASDHRPSTKTGIYTIKEARLVKIKDYELPRKKEWLGL